MEYRLTYQRTHQRPDLWVVQEEEVQHRAKAPLREVREVREVQGVQEEVAQEVGDPEGGTTLLQEHLRKVMLGMRTMGGKEVQEVKDRAKAHRAKASPLNTSV